MAVPQCPPARGRAQSIVEFAMVMPLFLLLVFALADFGRMEFSYISLANAAREMARTAAIPPTCSTPPLSPCNATTPPTSGFATSDVTRSSNAVDQSFMNYQGFILSTLHSTDTVVVKVYDKTSTLTGTATCTLPLDPTTCSIPTRFGLSGGYVDVVATFTFGFSPLFQNQLTGMIDASFMNDHATLSTTSRTYIE